MCPEPEERTQRKSMATVPDCEGACAHWGAVVPPNLTRNDLKYQEHQGNESTSVLSRIQRVFQPIFNAFRAAFGQIAEVVTLLL